MTEIERLLERLKGVKIHVSWEPGAKHLTPEERAAELNAALDEIDTGNFTELNFNDSRVPHYFGA